MSPSEPVPAFVRRPDVLHRRLTDGLLVLAPDGDQPVALRGTAPALWELLAAPHTLEQLVEALASRFQGQRPTIAADVAAAVDALWQDGLLRRAVAP